MTPAATPPPGFALILAGGGGTRLWPVSRRARAKQFLTLGRGETLLAATYRRAVALCGAERTLVVSAADQAEAIRIALPELPAGNLVLEPAARNTAPAVALGALAVARRAGDAARLAILPSDAFVADAAAFTERARLALAEAGTAIVTLGVPPARPETGFGYLQPGATLAPGVREVARFVEKPDLATAERYLREGYLWNAGMFFLTAGRLFAEARRHLPELAAAIDEARALDETEAAALLTQRYPRVPAISLDYGIMEKASGIRVVDGDFGWSDVGSWDGLGALHAPDAEGNVRVGDTLAVGAEGSVLYAEPGAPLVAVGGVSDLVVVATRDAVLVLPRPRAQEVRLLVEALRAAGREDLL